MNIRPTIRRFTRGQFVLLTMTCAAAVFLIFNYASSVYEDRQAEIRVAQQEVKNDFRPSDFELPPKTGQDVARAPATRVDSTVDAIRAHANRVTAGFLTVIFLLIASWIVIAWIWLGRNAGPD